MLRNLISVLYSNFRPGMASTCLFIGFCLAQTIAHCHSQGTLTITFDGPPTNSPGGGKSFIAEYFEAGMSFTPAPPGTNFIRVWPVLGQFGDPYNGTIYAQAGRSWETLRFSFTNGSAFEMVSVDLAE